MLNSKFNISDGIIELYVLGMLNEQEQLEVEEWIKNDPAAAEELEKSQMALAGLSSDEEVVPPADLKSKVMQAIDAESEEETVSSSFENEKAETTPTTQSPAKRPAGIINFYKWSSIAAVLVIATGAIYWVQMRSQLLERSRELTTAYSQIDSLQKENKSMVNQVGNLTTHQNQLIHSVNMMSDTNVFKVELATVNAEIGRGKVMIFWDKANGSVYCKPLVLPTIAKDKDFQLWSIENGQPVDMGVMHAQNTSEIIAPIKMNSTRVQPSAFAVTIEPKGGQESPTLDQMVVLGEVL